MNIAIVEDSRLARQELCALLAAHPEHRVVGQADSVRSGISLIESAQPDLVLLDIQLPDGDGFSLLEQLNYLPPIVFTTAYDEYALQAFKVSALDYLLKPVTAANLSSALAKAEKRSQNNVSGISSPAPKLSQNHIFFRDGQRYHFVRMADISLFEVDGNYTRIYYQGRHAMMPYSLSYVSERLDEKEFFRASRQHIVNLDHISTIEPWINDGLHIKLIDGREITVSRRQATAIRQLLSL